MAAPSTTPSSIQWTILSKSDVQESDFGGSVLLIPRSPETEEAVLAGARRKIDLWKTSRRPPSPTPQSKNDGDEDDQTHFPSGGPDYMTLERDLPKHPVVLIRKLSKGHDFYCGSSHVNHITLASPDKAEFCFIHFRHFYFRRSQNDLNSYVDLVNLSTSEFSFTIDGHRTNIGTGSIQRLSEGKQEATLGNGLEFFIMVASKSQSTDSSPALKEPSETQQRERIEDGPERSSKIPIALMKITKEQDSSKVRAKKHRRTNTDVDSKQSPKSSPKVSPQAKRARQASGDEVEIHSTSASRVVCTGDRTALLAVKQVTGENRLRNWKVEKDILDMMNHENVIQLVNTDRHRLTITTLYVGPDLSKYIKSDEQRFSVFSTSEACLLWRQIANGLAYIHSKKIAHFDIKPQNILLGASVAKICDFGLARRVENNTPVEYPGGTIPYLPPECLTFQVGDYPSDIWALGGTMVFLLGIIPLPKIPINFKSIGKDDAANEQLKQWQTQLTNHAAHVKHQGIRRLLLLHLSKDPAERTTASSLITENWQALPLPTTDHS